MRIETNVPDERGSAVVQLADELGLSSSQLVNEALVLFLKAVAEVRAGRRLVVIAPKTDPSPREVTTPTLSALAWLHNPQVLVLPPSAIAKMKQLNDGTSKPGVGLKNAVRRGKQ